MRKTSLFASLLCVLISTCVLGVGGDMGGADPNGSPEKPYLIEDLADFDTFADPNNAATYWAAGIHTKLTTDIDLSGRTYTTAVIGSFYGFFNGQSYVIDNLTITTPVATQGLAFIGSNEGEISNLGIINVSVTCGNECSGIGGLIGFNHGAITGSYSTGNIVSNNQTGFVGGLAGYNSGTISRSYFMGNVQTGDDFVGIGGLIGYNHNTIINCYCSGTVFSGQSVYSAGGLTGSNARSGNITNCYSTCELVSTDVAGGFVGGNGGYAVVINNCYWDLDINPTLSDSALGDLAGVSGKTTAEMQTQSTFVGWDFTTPVWRILRPSEDYPRLAWQEIFAGDIAGLYGVDLVDFAYLAKYWGQDCDSPACDRADVDESGTIDLPDLAAMANDWLK